MCIQFGFYKMTSSRIFACICVETDAEMVQDVIKGGIFGLLNLQFDPVFDAYTADSKNLPSGIINDQSEHESLEDIELTGECDYQNVIASKLRNKQITLSAMSMSYETFLELIASFSHVERLLLYHVFFEPTVSKNM